MSPSLHLALLACAACAASPAPRALDRELHARGYERVALARSPAGHLVLGLTVNGAAGTFILDTGAGGTVVDRRRASAFRLGPGAATAGGAGAGGGDLEVTATTDNRVMLGSTALAGVALNVMDLAHVNSALTQLGAQPVDGVLGADLLDRLQAVIDYRDRSLFVQRPR